ncbi:MAG: hypothetical protein EOO06_05995 [Chitinophagaceae bacterium]|nr:MAG: hypothetical protein EOO06_05995 [Chitinophagaceae bacterium]
MPTKTLPKAGDHLISLQSAIDMTTRFRAGREARLIRPDQDIDVLPLSETFHREAIDNLLAVPGCAAIRIYFGLDDYNKIHTLIVPVNKNNEDILSTSDGQNIEPIIVEVGQRCPPTCPPTSDLNT